VADKDDLKHGDNNNKAESEEIGENRIGGIA
jgi:hypothetical protein